MSKLHKLLGGLAAIGLLAALAVVGDFAAQPASSHVVTVKADVTSALEVDAQCFNCVENS
jgi:uncharacterized membrane protein